MKIILMIAVLLLSLGTLSLSAKDLGLSNLYATKWKLTETKDGIETYREVEPKGRIVGLRGKVNLNYPIDFVLSVLFDPNYANRKQWMDKVKEMYSIAYRKPLNADLYIGVELPKPISDRDFIFRATGDVDKKAQTATIQYQSFPSMLPDKDGFIRGSFDAVFALKGSVDTNGKTVTELDFCVLADPRGSIPVWLVNLVQRSYPYDLLDGLRKRLGTKEAKLLPEYEELMRK
jgi:hypothetical protein